MRLSRRRKPEPKPAPYLVPESHCGRHGYSVYLDGKRLAWGATETAAWATYQVRAA